MTRTVIEHVLHRLKEIGITTVFGVPGDYAFPVNEAICNDPEMRWIGCTNELNAAYAADGLPASRAWLHYARPTASANSALSTAS